MTKFIVTGTSMVIEETTAEEAVARAQDQSGWHWEAVEVVDDDTWTFVGHWEDDRIVVEYILPGRVDDRREDAGFWEQGLFAEAASGPTQEDALQSIRDNYESDEED